MSFARRTRRLMRARRWRSLLLNLFYLPTAAPGM